MFSGRHLLTYNQALVYVRTRHGVQADGDVGGDLPRIELQQAFMSSVIQKVNSSGLLTNSVQLLKLADLATRALTVDQGLDSVSKLLTLARSLTGLRARNVTLLTLPTVTDPANVNRLLPGEPADDVIFQLLAGGQAWPGRLPVMSPGQVRVQVMNGTGQPGLARQTARQLRALGFDVTGTGDAPAASTTTVSYAGTAQADSRDRTAERPGSTAPGHPWCGGRARRGPVGRPPLGGRPADQSASASSTSASISAGLFMVACAPARSWRVTRTSTSVRISASTMIPADTTKPREKPTASA